VNSAPGLRAFRHRDFRLFYVGQGVSQIGTWLQMIATSWLVFHLSGSAFMLGLAAFALQAPFLVLTPLAGVFIDRMDRRRVLMITNSIASLQATVMFSLRDFRDHLPLGKAVLIPWLQDFSLYRTYTPADVAAQIEAARTMHTGGFMLWNAAGVYTARALKASPTPLASRGGRRASPTPCASTTTGR